ncbi:MAG: class I SAM-dependent methyltransferase [Crocinitomicaceae bacterium]
MSNPWLDRWNERYSNAEFAYGELPNEFLKAQLEQLPAGKILFAAEGEGRNSVFAAQMGWTVAAFDISSEGKKKAMQLAEKNGVTVDYQVGELQDLHFEPQQFDAIALIYAHFPAEIKSQLHQALDKMLRTGGTVIFEAFSKNNLAYVAKNEKVGGPRDLAILCSVEELQHDFPNYDIQQLAEVEIELNEGLYHNGTGSVVRFVGTKK